MSRKRGTDASGRGFTPERRNDVWDRAATALGRARGQYRRDIAGNIVYKPSYGLDSSMGWEIDHIKPVSKGGTDNLRNLQVLQTATNQSKGNTYPWCPEGDASRPKEKG